MNVGQIIIDENEAQLHLDQYRELVKQRRTREDEEIIRNWVNEKEQERLRARAEAAEAKGQAEKAEVLREQAEETRAPVLAPAIRKPAGMSTREVWSAEVVDADLLISAVLDGQVPREALVINQSFLDGQARLQKATMQIPGVRAVKRDTVVARGR